MKIAGSSRKELILGIICSSPPGEVFTCVVTYILPFSLSNWWLSLGGRCGEIREVELEERRKKTIKLAIFFPLCKFPLATNSMYSQV